MKRQIISRIDIITSSVGWIVDGSSGFWAKIKTTDYAMKSGNKVDQHQSSTNNSRLLYLWS
jgi:hypothetical protein